MAKKNKFLIGSAFVILVILTFLLLSRFVENEKSDFKLVFRKSYGNIILTPDSDNTLSLSLIVSNVNKKSKDYIDDLEMIHDFTLHEKINIISYTFEESIKYMDNTYYYLNLILTPTKEFTYDDKIEVNEIKMGNDTYTIGRIFFEIVPETVDNEKLKVTSVSAMNYGNKLSNYFLTILNNTEDLIQIDKINFKDFDIMNPQIEYESINNEVLSRNMNIQIEEGEEVRLNILFDDKMKPNYEVFYFTPNICYKFNNTNYTLKLDYYVSGINISKSEFKEICKNLK